LKVALSKKEKPFERRDLLKRGTIFFFDALKGLQVKDQTRLL